MSDMIVTSGSTEVQLGTAPAPAEVKHNVSNDWRDMQKDMAAIEKELSQPEQPASSPAPATAPEPEAKAAPTPAPVTPPPAAVVPPAAAPVEVPEKFRDPSGKLDTDKLLKSYFEAEKGLKRAQNAQAPAPVAAAPAAVPAAPQGPITLSPFERQVAQDLINEAAAVGYAMPEGQAIAQARVQIRLMEAKHQADKAATFAKVDQFEQALAERTSRDELQALAKDHAWVLTPEGHQQLTAIQAEKPWMFKESPTPWADAVEVLIGRKAKGSQGLVNMPTPTGSQQAVAPLPATPAPAAPAPVTLNTKDEIENYVKTLTPEQERIFWAKAIPGAKFDPTKQYRGL
jgi:hypothetical protein